MVTQSNTLIDAARKAGVKHVVHLGVFADWDCTDPYSALPLPNESDIQASGRGWTHLHLNLILDKLMNFSAPRADRLTLYWRKRSVSWIAVSDITAVAAAVLNGSPGKHHGRDYWMSTGVLNGSEVAEVSCEVPGRSIGCNLLGPEECKVSIASPGVQMEPWYAAGGLDFMKQVSDGRMGYIRTTCDNVPYVRRRPALTFQEWACAHKEEFIQIASSDADPARMGNARSQE